MKKKLHQKISLLFQPPFIWVLLIFFLIYFNSFIPLTIKQFLYSISLILKSFILFCLPFIILLLMFISIHKLAAKATKIILIVFFGVSLSNFSTVFISQFVGRWIYQRELCFAQFDANLMLCPLWEFSLPLLMSNEFALISGILGGFFISQVLPAQSNTIASILEKYVAFLLKGLKFLIPPFIMGFIVKLAHEKMLQYLFKDYTAIFAVICLALCTYVLFLYLVVNSFRLRKTLEHLGNMLPAAFCGFTTMSSAASMPFTIIGVEKSTENKELSKSLVPATVNIHLIGDCMAIPIFAFAILKSFGIPEPTLANYTIFTFYFALARFSVAAIPGGGILMTLPILEKYLGFQSDMASLITTLYILFDPILTSVNIFGNGAFIKIIDRTVDRR